MRKFVCLLMLLSFCLLPLQGQKKTPLSSYGKKNIVVLAYKALQTGNFSIIEKSAMNAEKYKALPETKEKLKGKDGEKMQKIIMTASLRSKKIVKESFQITRKVLNELKFDWKKAKVIAVYVKKPIKTMESTSWTNYQVTDKRVRLDIYYTIESMGNYVKIKLDDTFLVGEKRYLGSGYRLQVYKPKELNDNIKKSIMKYHLNGFIYIPKSFEDVISKPVNEHEKS